MESTDRTTSIAQKAQPNHFGCLRRYSSRQISSCLSNVLADSLALRDFLGVGLEVAPPDHSTISRTRRLLALETHRAVFTWILQCLGTAGLVKGKTIGLDATTLEANAALRSVVRRDSGRPMKSF
jgi:transposase